jgi:tape measure domain-containing protein
VADDYPIAIKIDPGPALQAIPRVTSELGKAEAAGERTGAAISRGFRAGAAAADGARDSMGRFVTGARAGGTAADGAAKSSTSLARAFDGVAQAIQREQQMLTRIQGPLQRYERELQTLDSLQGRGAISTGEYANQVARLNRELERSNAIGRARPAVVAAVAPAAGGGMLAGAGGMAAAAGLAVGAREILNAANTYQGLQNRMRVVAQEGESVSSTFAKISASAVATRSSIEATTIAYQRLRGATKEMGLSSGDLLRVTERINKAIVVSGASAAEAQGGMIQLAQGIASNRLGGDELRSVLENLPYVADILAQSLGVTRGKLRELGEQGKLTAAVIIGAFEKMGSKIDKDFGKTAPTLGQQWALLQDQIMITVGKVFEGTGLFKILGGIVSNVGAVFGFVGDVMKTVSTIINGLTDALGPLGDAIGYVLNPLQALKDLMGLVSDVAGALVEAFGIGDDAATRSARAYLGQMEAMKKLHAEEVKLERASVALAAARGAGIAAPAFDLDAAKQAAKLQIQFKQALGVDIPSAFDEATRKGLDLDAAITKIRDKRALDDVAEQAKRTERALSGVNDTLRDNEKHWDGMRERVKDLRGALAKLEADRAFLVSKTGAAYGNQRNQEETRLELAVKTELRDKTLELDNSEFKYGETVVGIRKRTLEKKDALDAVHGSYKAGRITLAEYTEGLKSLGVEEDRATKMLREIRQPATDYRANIAALNTLLNQGRITLDEYSAAIRRTSDAYGGSELRKLIESAGAPKAAPKVSLGGGPLNLGEGYEGLLDDAIDIDGNVSRERFDALQKYEADVAGKMAELEISWQGPEDRDLAADLAAAEKMDKALEKAAKTGKSFEDGLSRGLAAIRDNLTDVGSAIETTLTNAFKGAEDALVSFVTTGKADFKSMVNSMLADLTRLLIRQAAAGLIKAIGSGASGGAGAAVAAAPDVYDTIFGGGKAFGGDYRVGGSGGPDSQLVTFALTPGEHLAFTPPGASPRSEREAMPQPRINVIVVDDEKSTRRFMENEGERYYQIHRRRDDPAKRGRTTGR